MNDQPHQDNQPQPDSQTDEDIKLSHVTHDYIKIADKVVEASQKSLEDMLNIANKK